MRIGCFGVVSRAPSESGVAGAFADSGDSAFKTSSAAATRQASRTTFVSMTHVKSLPYAPPVLTPEGPLSRCDIIFPASLSDTWNTAARLARTCGDTLATNNLPSPLCPFVPLLVPLAVAQGNRSGGCALSVVRTSLCDWSCTSTASADVTHPEQAKQSVREI